MSFEIVMSFDSFQLAVDSTYISDESYETK